MDTYRSFVGLDVHARSIVGCALDAVTGEVTHRSFGGGNAEVLAWLRSLSGPVFAVYEAGPTGFGLFRACQETGIACVVAAPSKLQRPVGEKVKTDKNDALHLARLAQLGQITAVRVPSVGEEAARDLVRAHEDVRIVLMSARHRVSKLLLRQGIVYDRSLTTWTQKHQRWLLEHHFQPRSLQIAYENNCEAVLEATARRARLEKEMLAIAADSDFTPIVNRLGVLRGMAPIPALGLAVEIGDWSRFTGSTIGSFVGLVPAEYSTGGSRSQGAITKVGNAHARWILVEAAWQHKRYLASTPGRTLQTRRQAAPLAVRARGDDGNRRLHRQWVKYVARNKKNTIAATAIARELAGWCWSVATMDA